MRSKGDESLTAAERAAKRIALATKNAETAKRWRDKNAAAARAYEWARRHGVPQ
jgi:hypothetical protein